MGVISLQINEHIAVLTMNNPPANALSSELLKALSEKLNEIEEDETVKAIVLQGEGKFFSAGADITEFTSLQNASDYTSLSKNGQHLFDRIEHFSVPVIAAVYGAALGGGLELAMACHMRIVTEDAKLGLPEMTLGIIPGFAGTQRLPRYVGTAQAYEMILTGEPISGKEAADRGLANRSVSENEVLNEAMELATKVAAQSKPAIHHVMELVPYGKSEQFSQGVEKEAQAFGNIFGSEDAREGVKAFMQKRKPHFIDQ